MEGNQPYWPENLVRRHVRPAAVQAGIAKTIGWHFQTLVRNATQVNGEDIKVVQESLRHASHRVTLAVYTQAVTPTKRAAQRRVLEQLGTCDNQLAPRAPRTQRQ